ncbi:hypothetical protein [Aliiruegeria lutimaris]|uniref:DUF1127 domain-containing protein n=1 Tax=Aliiruegeria lutimaris TaxID=571298 RepID=A0A1G8U816_9RHOB|nr:hypothetical protein [Aliiruegeria lutimaris]SDJ49859.1 hypothetical protein SAMN04488026_101878 [Aliiruegeria lutimaris]
MVEKANARKPIPVYQVLLAPLRGLWEMMVAGRRHESRIEAIEALSCLSDDELDARGMTRADILPHVYRDHFKWSVEGRDSKQREIPAG